MTISDRSDNNQLLIDDLKRFATFQELRDSESYQIHKNELRLLLDEPRAYQFPGARPRLTSFLRVVEWNIQRGARLDGIIEALNTHPILRFADLLLLNELDDGMIRSRNLNVALELTKSLEAHAIFGAEYLEFTKGVDDEVSLPGANTRALHGNAILTRHLFANPMVIKLPRCTNNFESEEKRIGGRIGIVVDLELGGSSIVVGNTHLDVTNTPRCRGKQMRAMLEAVEARLVHSVSSAAIVGGDLNTHTFARGTRFRAIKNSAVILAGNRKKLASRLAHPEVKEPAVSEFEKFGFDIEAFNDRKSTSRTIVSNLDDAARLPWLMKWWVNRRIPAGGLTLSFRLDWLSAKGLRALRDGEVTDRQTGVSSIRAQALQNLIHEGQPLSDHDPIVVDVEIPVHRRSV